MVEIHTPFFFRIKIAIKFTTTINHILTMFLICTEQGALESFPAATDSTSLFKHRSRSNA